MSLNETEMDIITQRLKDLNLWKNTLYARCRDKLIFHSPSYLKWFKQQYPKYDAHHLTGSMGRLKLCDALLVELERPEHNKADLDRELYFYQYLPQAMADLLAYVKYLEDKNNIS